MESKGPRVFFVAQVVAGIPEVVPDKNRPGSQCSLPTTIFFWVGFKECILEPFQNQKTFQTYRNDFF